MQSTNTGILKPALWHTPAITNDGIIRQAPDPREKHQGFTPRSPQGVERRGLISRAPAHCDLHRLAVTCLCWVSGEAVLLSLWLLRSHQRLRRCNTWHTPACCSISCTPALSRPARTPCNSMLNRETLQGSALITCPADISHYFPANSDKELEGDTEAVMLSCLLQQTLQQVPRQALPQQEE